MNPPVTWHANSFPWKRTALNINESMIDLTCYTDLHFLIADAIFDDATIVDTSKIRRQEWTKSFQTHPHFNLYSCARISIFLGLFERAYTKNDCI